MSISKGNHHQPVRPAEKGNDPPKVVGTGRRCSDCGGGLNRYNPSTICGACRVKRRGGGPPLTGGQAGKAFGR